MRPIGIFSIFWLSLAAAAWSRPLTLDQAVELGLTNQPTLLHLEGRVQEASGRLDQALTLGQPSLGLQAAYVFNDPPLQLNVAGNVLDAVVPNNWSAGLSLRQVVSSFGRLHWRAAQAELERRALEAELAHARNRVREEVRLAYYQLLLDQGRIQVRQDDLKARQAQLESARSQVRAGIAPGFDIERDRAGLASSEQALAAAERDREVSRARLERLLGVDGVEPEALPDTPPPPPPEPASVWEQALQRRQDLQARRWAIEAGQARVESAQAEDNPTLTFQSDYSRRNALGLYPGQLWSTGLVLSIPLFDGGNSAALTRQAEGVLAQLRADYTQACRDLRLEVEEGAQQLRYGWTSLTSSRLELDSAQSAAGIARARYRNGLSINVELLEAESALSQARQNALEARYHYLQSWARWERIVSL